MLGWMNEIALKEKLPKQSKKGGWNCLLCLLDGPFEGILILKKFQHKCLTWMENNTADDLKVNILGLANKARLQTSIHEALSLLTYVA